MTVMLFVLSFQAEVAKTLLEKNCLTTLQKYFRPGNTPCKTDNFVDMNRIKT